MQTSLFRLPMLKKQFKDQESIAFLHHDTMSLSFKPYKARYHMMRAHLYRLWNLYEVMSLYVSSRPGNLPYPIADVFEELTKTSSDLQKHLSPMKDNLPGCLVESPSYGLHLVSMP
jgi:hypothetical protein